MNDDNFFIRWHNTSLKERIVHSIKYILTGDIELHITKEEARQLNWKIQTETAKIGKGRG